METISTIDALKAAKYYNIAVILMIPTNPMHAIHFYGEDAAFTEWKKANDLANILRNEGTDSNTLVMNYQYQIIRCHERLTALCLSQQGGCPVWHSNESGSICDEGWLGDYAKKSEIIDFYSKIPEIYKL